MATLPCRVAPPSRTITHVPSVQLSLADPSEPPASAGVSVALRHADAIAPPCPMCKPLVTHVTLCTYGCFVFSMFNNAGLFYNDNIEAAGDFELIVVPFRQMKPFGLCVVRGNVDKMYDKECD